MIAEVCRFYGWTDEHCLAMPAKRFFLMRDAARKIMATELVHQCYVSRSAQLVQHAFEETIEYFRAIGGPREVPVIPQKAPRGTKDGDKEPSKPLKGDAAKYAVMHAFALDRRVARSPRPRKPGKG